MSLGPGFIEITRRYPHDVAQGTAIPRWAFFNVTVCYLSTLWSTERDLTQLRLDLQSLPDQTFNDTMAVAIGRTSDASRHTLCVSDVVVG